MTKAEERPETGVTKQDVVERLADFREEARTATAYLLTGDGSGRIRRNALYIAAAVLIIAGLPLLALLPLLLLALTDAVVLP